MRNMFRFKREKKKKDKDSGSSLPQRPTPLGGGFSMVTSERNVVTNSDYAARKQGLQRPKLKGSVGERKTSQLHARPETRSNSLTGATRQLLAGNGAPSRPKLVPSQCSSRAGLNSDNPMFASSTRSCMKDMSESDRSIFYNTRAEMGSVLSFQCNHECCALEQSLIEESNSSMVSVPPTPPPRIRDSPPRVAVTPLAQPAPPLPPRPFRRPTLSNGFLKRTKSREEPVQQQLEHNTLHTTSTFDSASDSEFADCSFFQDELLGSTVWPSLYGMSETSISETGSESGYFSAAPDEDEYRGEEFRPNQHALMMMNVDAMI